MGRIAKVLSYAARSAKGIFVGEIKANPGGGENITVEHYAPAGDDSQPLPGDYVATLATQGTGRSSAVGFVDIKNAKQAGPGEKRIYARNAAGEILIDVHLKSDGSGAMKNAAGGFELASSGTVTINGVTISPTGLITTPTGVVTPSAIVADKELANHDHPAGVPPGNTGPNNP